MSRGAQTGQEPPAQIGLDTPLRLEQAVKLAFPFGGMTVSGLRRERDRGNICFEKIAGKDFVTLQAIKEMRARCRENQKVPASICENVVVENQSGSSSTERMKSAQLAAHTIAEALKRPSPITLVKSTAPHGSVVTLQR